MEHVVQTSDLAEVEALLSEAYTTVRLRSDSAVFFRSTSVPLRTARIDRLECRMVADMAPDPMTSYSVCHVRSGRAEHRVGDSTARYGAGDLFVSPSPGTPFTAWLSDLDLDTLSLDERLLDTVAGTAPGDASPVSLSSCRPVSRQGAAAWLSLLGAVRQDAADGSLGRTAVGRAEQALALATLRTFPSNASFDPTIEDRHDARPEALRRAIAYIEAHPDQDVTVADIASAARVTIRAVQLAFRRHLDTTPMAYQRRVRLAHAREELLAGGDELSVIDVATRWGFFNPGRFAASYRREYGALPHHTLGREQPHR